MKKSEKEKFLNKKMGIEVEDDDEGEEEEGFFSRYFKKKS